jgi:UDP-GlcNAc:undecaprenyl-phosphate GlcNAc-1-phosphate transferase
MDNMNGLTAGLSIVIIGGISILAWSSYLDSYLVLLGILVSASILGFGMRNFPLGKIYMGDQGSQLLGFFVTAFAITVWLELFQKQIISSIGQGILLLILLFFLFFADVVTVVTIRLREGRSPFIGDQCHLSHQLVRRGFNATQSVLILIGINSCLAILVYFLLAS